MCSNNNLHTGKILSAVQETVMKYKFSCFHFAFKKDETTMSLFLKLYLLAYSHAQILKKNKKPKPTTSG